MIPPTHSKLHDVLLNESIARGDEKNETGIVPKFNARCSETKLFNQKGYRICPVYDQEKLIGIISRKRLLAVISGKRA